MRQTTGVIDNGILIAHRTGRTSFVVEVPAGQHSTGL